MPERLFKYHDTQELLAGVKDLGQLLASSSGVTVALKNSNTGFLKQSGEVSRMELRNTYMNARYEIWLRGQGVDGAEANEQCADLESTNPLREKAMTMVTVYGSANGLC